MLIIVAFSCSSDDDNTVVDNQTFGSKIKSVKKFNSSQVLETTIDYGYNSVGNVSSYSISDQYQQTTEITFNYGGDENLISFEEVKTDAFDDVRIELNNLEYQDGLITQICQDITYDNATSSFDDPEVDKIDFQYDASQNVVLYTHYNSRFADNYTCSDVTSVYSTEDLEYDSNENMVRYENSDYFWSPTYLTYTYDDKNHPYKNIKPDAFRKLIGSSTNNNIMSANEYNADTDELTATIAFAYEYNASGYPTKLTKTYTVVGGTLSQVSVFEYEYY